MERYDGVSWWMAQAPQAHARSHVGPRNASVRHTGKTPHGSVKDLLWLPLEGAA